MNPNRTISTIWEHAMELDMEELMDFALELESISREMKTAYFSRELTEQEAYDAEANQSDMSDEMKDMLRRMQ
jgi:hypothetical protein